MPFAPFTLAGTASPLVPVLARVQQIQEITYTTGVGPYVLAGATAGYFRFAQGYSAGETVIYKATDGDNVEVNEGTFDGIGTLTRDTLLASSTGEPIAWSGITRPLVWPLVPPCDCEIFGQLVDVIPPITLLATNADLAMGVTPIPPITIVATGHPTVLFAKAAMSGLDEITLALGQVTNPFQSEATTGPISTTFAPSVVMVYVGMFQNSLATAGALIPAVASIGGSTLSGFTQRSAFHVVPPNTPQGYIFQPTCVAVEEWWTTTAANLTNEVITVNWTSHVAAVVVNIVVVKMGSIAGTIFDTASEFPIIRFDDNSGTGGPDTHPSIPGLQTLNGSNDLVLGYVAGVVGTDMNVPSDDGSIFMSDPDAQAIHVFSDIDLTCALNGFFVVNPGSSAIPQPPSNGGSDTWIMIGDAITGTGFP